MNNVNNKNLFCINTDKPMKFVLIEQNMLRIKYNQIKKSILEHGGIIIDFNEKDNECIILGEKNCTLYCNFFNTNYIKKCIKKNKILNLQDYQILKTSEHKSISEHKESISLSEILSQEKCPHRVFRTAEEDLSALQKL